MSWVTVGAYVCILIAPCSCLQQTEVNQAVSCSLVTLKPWAQTASTASRIKDAKFIDTSTLTLQRLQH